MKGTPNIRSDKGSPTNRPNSPSARSINSASQFRKCKSQSVISAGIVPSSQHCPATGARERRTRQQLSVPVQPEYRRHALPCDELSGEMKYGNTTGDFITRPSVAAKNKPPTSVKCEDCLGHDGQPQGCSGTVVDHEMHRISNEKDLDTFPPTSSFPAIVQDDEHRHAVNPQIEQHYPCAAMSGSSTDFDTSWSSWTSDYSDKKHKHLSKSNTSLSANKVSKVYHMLTVKRQLTSPMIQSKPTKEPLASRGSPTRRISSPRKKQNSCDNVSTTRPMKSSDNPVSRKTHSVSPQKPISRKPTVGEKLNGSIKVQSPFRNISSIGQHRKTLDCLSSSVEKNTLKLNNSAKPNESQEMSRRGSPDKTKMNTTAKSLSSVSKQLAKHSVKYVSPNRKGTLSPSLTEQAKSKTVQERSKSFLPKDIHQGAHPNLKSKNSASRGNSLNRFKQMKTNRSDRSTDSGYQESVSRATLDWLSGTKGAIHHSVVAHYASPQTNYHFGQMISHTETLVYSGGGEDHSERFIYTPNSGDGALQTSADSNASDTFFPLSLDTLTEDVIHQSPSTTDLNEREPETSFTLGHITEEEVSKLTNPDTTMSSMIVDDHKVSEEDTIFGQTEQDIEVEERVGFSSETYNLSDTKSVISDMIENSDTTDVTADWDATATSVSESNKKTPTPLRFELPVEKVSLSKNDRSPIKKSRSLSPARCLHLPPQSKKARKSESKAESGASQNSLKKANGGSLNKPSQLNQISQTDLTLLPIRGFNSNTRRTVEINYGLVTMTESRSARSSLKQITLSSSALNPTKRSQSEPPPMADRCTPKEGKLPRFNTAGSSNIGPVDVNTPYRRCARKSSSVAEPSEQSASHQSTPSIARSAGRVVNSCLNFRIPEPQMMYLSLVIVIIMCFTLAHLMVYRVLG
ncbi:hypothetical protein BgiMline_029073 [Biomphalaria glabrata]|nr:hypothetical protein BgiMline_025705 [Biomphalaria glabrata]